MAAPFFSRRKKQKRSLAHTRSADLLIEQLEDRNLLSTLAGHTVLLDGDGKIVPWNTSVANAYSDFLVQRWNFVKNAGANAPSPAPNSACPQYYFYDGFNTTNTAISTDNWMNDVGEKIPNWVESGMLYYAYSGDTAVMGLVKSLVDYTIDHGMSAANAAWPNFPHTAADFGETTYDGFDGSGVFHKHEVHVDLAGDMGLAFYRMYQFYGEGKYLTAATNIANVLVANVRKGNASQSPWPLRVRVDTGAITAQYGANWAGSYELLTELAAAGIGDVSGYTAAANKARDFMLNYPMKTLLDTTGSMAGNWTDGHSDCAVNSNTYKSNLSKSNLALFMLDHPEFDPNFSTNLPAMIAWTEKWFVNRTDSSENGGSGTYYGANVVGEQDAFNYKMDYQTARYAAECARWYAVSGDTTYLEKAYRSLNFVTYCSDAQGRGFESPFSPGIATWWSDEYGEAPRMFYQAFAGRPEFAPARENHILYSENAIRTVAYADTSVSYTAAKGNGIDYLRLKFMPGSITIGGRALSRRSDLTAEGFTVRSLGDGDYAVNIRRDGPAASGINVQITALVDTQPPDKPTGVAITFKTDTTASLSWNASSDDVGVLNYVIFRNGTSVGTSVGTSFTDTGLIASTAYTYTIKAVDGAGNHSPVSDPLGVTTGAPDVTAPTTPTGLNVTAKTFNSVSLAWIASKDNYGVARYDIFRDGTKVGSSTAASFVDAGLIASTGYSYTVQAFDATGNASVTSNAVTATTDAAAPLSFWDDAVLPSTIADSDAVPIELGVKFRADVAGTITALRFYKSDTNTGTHVGHLWTSTGTLLATVTFTNETASGWQTALLSGPVTVSANTTYIASYHTDTGHYSSDNNYFLGVGVDNGMLHALASGVDGGNGVYHYGSSAFPSNTFQATNYWVDVVFLPASTPQMPVFTTQPQNQSVSVGTSVTFTAAATAAGTITYTWQRNNVDIPNANGATYTIASPTLADNSAQFRCIATNAAGSTPSNPATLTVSSTLPTITSISPATGLDAGGTSVVIIGTKFTGATQVLFGNTEATSFTVNSATRITAIAPPRSAGQVDVTVVAPAGTSAVTPAGQFSYTTAGSGNNIAILGSAYRWCGLPTATSDSNRTAATTLNDNDLTNDVALTGGPDDTINAYEAAGIIWSTSQSVANFTFKNGDYDAAFDGVFAANVALQFTIDGATWTDATGWSISPAYAYNSAEAGGVTYAFTGSAATVRGVRVVGQVRIGESSPNSWFARVAEVQAFGPASNNQAPTNISMSATSIAENRSSGTVVGNLGTTDPDSGNTFTYALVFGTGSADNASFALRGSQLIAAASFNYETKSSYSIRIRSTDQGGLFVEKQLSISVTNVNESPASITLSTATIAENKQTGTVVGAFTGTDPDAGQGETLAFRLVSGFGDNATFTLDANGQLKTAAIFNFETKRSYSIKVRATDAGVPALTCDRMFTLNVVNVVERAPVITGITTDTGTSGDGITSDATLLISGTAEPAMTITVLQGGTTMGTVAADATGKWTFDASAATLVDGTYAFTATASDTLGNVSAACSCFSVTVDTAAPLASIASVTTPRTTAVDTLTITFDQAVTGFNLADIKLARNGASNLLTSRQKLTITTPGIK